jgi:two-component system NarL family sensor kinase
MLHRNVRNVSNGKVWPDASTATRSGSGPPRPLSDSDPLGVFQQIIGGLSEQAALIGDDWTILAVNEAWAQTVSLNGLADFKPGANYYREVAKLAQTGNPPADAVLRALDEISQGKRKSFRLVYEGGGQQAGKQFEARLTVIGFGDRTYLMVTRYDITELIELRSLRDDFKLSLLKTQEDERRRMGRELHDSGLQMLACLSLALVRLKRSRSQPERDAVTADMEELLLMARREFRAISYLAHPPQLENLSLEDALRMLIEGFGQRSGLDVEFTVEGELDALDHSAEHAVYRVVQEAISNVHRHAAARKLTVRVVERDQSLHVVVGDDGRGVPDGIRYGVGLEGMQARLKELGGRLTIFRRSPGTTVLASLPLAGRTHERGSIRVTVPA